MTSDQIEAFIERLLKIAEKRGALTTQSATGLIAQVVAVCGKPE